MDKPEENKPGQLPPRPATARLRLTAEVEAAAKQWPDRVAVRMREQGTLRSYTYREVSSAARAGAESLVQAGLRPGDRVALIAHNSPEWPIAYLTVLFAGGTVVPIDPGLTRGEIVALLDFVSPRLLLLSQKTAALLAEHALRWPHRVIGPVLAPSESLAWPALGEPTIDPDADPEIAAIVFTAGTSGSPKGVMLTHGNVLYAARQMIATAGMSARDEILGLPPLHHVYGGVVMLAPSLLSGAGISFLETLSLEALLAAAREFHPTLMPAVPRLLELINAQIEQRVSAQPRAVSAGLSLATATIGLFRARLGLNLGTLLFRPFFQHFGGQLRHVGCGGAPLSPEVAMGLYRMGFTISQAYGLTETAGLSVVNLHPEACRGSVGQALPQTSIQIIHPNEAGQGEICIRGPGVMRGYFRNPEATAAALRDGWFCSGDLGQLQDGHLFVLGRADEVIVTANGKKAAPHEVERHYQGLPRVREIAVLGMRSAPGANQEIHACIALELEAPDGRPLPEVQAAVRAAVAGRAQAVPAHLRIQRVHFEDDIPKTTKQSVRRGELRSRLMAKLSDATRPAVEPRLPVGGDPDEAPRDPLLWLQVEAAMKKILRAEGSLCARTTLHYDLGLDSLGCFQLQSALESTTGLHFKEPIVGMSTLGDVLLALKESGEAEARTPESKPDLTVFGKEAPRRPWELGVMRIFRAFTRLIWDVDVCGVENLPQSGAMIVCPNHQSHLDFFWVASFLPAHLQKNLFCFSKIEHFRSRLLSPIVRLARAIPVDRGGNFGPALRRGLELVQSGMSLFIHPEGTRTRNGTMGAFRRGAAKLALETGAPLVPVRIIGAYDIYPPHSRFPRLFNWRARQKLPLRIVIGAPIYPALLPRDSTDRALSELTLALQGAVVNLD